MKRHIIWSVLSSLMPTRKRPQTQASAVQADTQRPPDEDKEAWRKYWEERGQPWRQEPEISEERKAELANLCAIKMDTSRQIIPFKDKLLTRADIEWLIEFSQGEPLFLPMVNLKGANLEKADLRGSLQGFSFRSEFRGS